jgi:hypothetical protein
MPPTVGRFYFKLTDSKNLIGEFSNDHKTCKRNYTEGAVRNLRNPEEIGKPEDDKFVGEYFSTWYEEVDGASVLAELKIERKPATDNIFILAWRLVLNNTAASKPSFQGEGMLCDGTLIGNYWSC